MPESVRSGAVLVAIPTRGRRDLRPALEELARQADECEASVEIVLIDNSGAADPVVGTLGGAYACSVRVVSQPGLAQVRNAALDLVRPQHRALIFLDDDERPEPCWLEAMLAAHANSDAAVVLGPVRSTVPEGSAAWLRGGQFLRRHLALADGPYDGEVYSGNTLIDAEFLRNSGIRFDPDFDQTGGEDTDFFRRLRLAGGGVVWSQDAAAIEHVDPDRLTVRGAVDRSFHAANLSWALDSKGLAFPKQIRTLARRTARLPLGAGRMVLGALRRRPDRIVQGLCDCAATAGLWASALGLRTRYYR